MPQVCPPHSEAGRLLFVSIEYVGKILSVRDSSGSNVCKNQSVAPPCIVTRQTQRIGLHCLYCIAIRLSDTVILGN